MIGTARARPASIRSSSRTALKHLDYSEYGGAPLLGVNGVSIISHGKSSPRAIKNAIKVAVQAVESRMNEHIGARLGSRRQRDGGVKRPVAYIAGTGRGIPAKVMTNHDFAALGLETIARVDRRAHRHQSSGTSPTDGETTCSHGRRRPRAQAMERAGVHAGRARRRSCSSTATPDRLLPSTAVDLQAELGATRAAAFDISRGVLRVASTA